MTTPEHERGRIDAGRTGDKVAFPDPAAAPLGTDAEAAGQASSAAQPRALQTPPHEPPGASDERLRRIDGNLTATGRRRAAVLTVAGLLIVSLLGLALALVGLGLR
ncbi:hypothetical protein [Alsobacter sp. R-9]